MLTRVLAGVILAAIVASVARRIQSLTTSGAVAATIVGTVAVAAGWSWGVILITYFAASSVLSRTGRADKQRFTAAIVAKDGRRDAFQVLANGGTFAVAALVMWLHPDPRWMALGVGSIAASAADTWATEIGTLYGNQPRSVLTWRRVPPGTSGGISLLGTLGACAGTSFIGIVAHFLGWDATITNGIVIGGVAGAMIDSVLGATVQSRRWCDACTRETERIVHDCGTATRIRRGIDWVDNDVVNFLSSALGGLLAVYLVG